MGDKAGGKSALPSQLKQIGALTAIPVILLMGPLLGYFAGDWIDRKFQVFPWFTIIFLFLGFVASGREIFRLLKRVLKEEANRSADHD